MIVERKWFCSCTGQARELVYVETAEDDAAEPACPRCGASPSSDPKRTVTFQDTEKPSRALE